MRTPIRSVHLLSPAVLFVLLLAGMLSAQPVRLENDDFEIQISPDSKIVSRHDDGWETKMVVEQDGQRVRISWREDQALILFPSGTVKVSVSDGPAGRTITTFVNGKRYEIVKSPREIKWSLAGQEVYFRTRGGKVNQVVASNDFLKLYTDTPARRITLESSVGTTDALINSKGVLETFDGPEVTEHLYLVRGFSYQKGPVTLRYPLPESPFLEALPKDRYLTVKEEIVPLATPAQPALEEDIGNPLQAAPSTWSSPELRANEGNSKEDPLNVRREKRVRHPEDPLKAKTDPNSENLLQLKEQTIE